MALPDSRNTTYAADSQVLSADLNDIQDCIVEGKHGARTHFLSAARAIFNGSAAEIDIGAELIWLSSGIINGYCPIPAKLGDRVTAVEVYVEDSGAVTVTAKLYLVNVTDGSVTPVDVTPVTAGTAVRTTLAFVGLPVTIAANQELVVEIDMGGANCLYYGAKVVLDRL